MAKRSDFAQKLLDDLRLRKERMSTSSQTSNRSNSMAIIDAYSYAKQNYRGSKDVRTNEMIGSRAGNTRLKSSGGSRSSLGGESAKQLVSYGRGQGSEQLGDLSMALRFAIENAGKLGRTDSSTRSSMLGFLQHMGRSSMSNVDRHRPSTSQLPAFSSVQIEEISKGAMKLNQILKACSNGLNFDSYSIEIGKELLKGAIDLENSLKMLVNLQEASEFMVSTQKKKKNRIKLLEEGEEDEDESNVNIAEEWKLDLPRFSFDKPSRKNIQEFGRTGHKQSLPALTNSTQHSNFNHENQLVPASRSSSHHHNRSISYSSNARRLSTSSERKNHLISADSKSEKARIPSVIAKLMGLDKLPETENSTSAAQKNYSSKPKDERDQSFRRVTQEEETPKIVGHKTNGPENLLHPKKQKVVEVNKTTVGHNSPSVVVNKEKKVPSPINFEVVMEDEKPPWENSKGSKAMTRSEKAMARKDEQQNVVVQHKQNTGRMDNKKQFSSSQKKSQNKLELQQPFVPRKLASEEREHNGKQVLQTRKQKGSTGIEVMAKISKPVRDGTNLQQKQPQSNQEKLNKKSLKKSTNADEVVIERSSAESNVVKGWNNRNPDQNSSPKLQEPESRKEKPRIPPVMDDKAVHVPILQRAKVARGHNNEVLGRRSGSLNNLTRPPRHQSSILKEVKSRKVEKIRDIRPEEAEPRIIKSNRSTVNNQLNDLTPNLLKEEVENTYPLNTSKEDDYKSLHEPEELPSNDSDQNVIPITEEDQTPFGEDQEHKCGGNVPNELTGADTDNKEKTRDISVEKPELKQEKIVKTIMEPPSNKLLMEPLSESENQLKQILIKSQLFLNTAEALFKLDIPIEALDNSDINSGGGGGHDYQDNIYNEDRKLILDCGYELMRRKGRKQEVALHPCVTVSISLVKITTFDWLVKQLSKDFEKLRSYGRNGVDDCEVDEYLPRMLESDVFNKDPYVNCMWDLGWNEGMFAFVEVDEVVRDVEKYLLNGVLDDITGDLLLHNMSVLSY
ncbi:uncharacterized protein LOC133804302 [Humulus lupulus]|uniref:uncharacterized protein LOC133804302 n=1 Tax=Humulus lupulus TaxID=3486 RepID=UPI002B416187|nr:uncharacterized protein LOC133804302 [Humulus lupulus]